MRSPTLAGHSIWRWEIARGGLYLVSLNGALGEFGRWHVHAHCVVDDFGDLVPVAFSALDACGRLYQ